MPSHNIYCLTLGFLLPWTWGISSQLLQQSTAAAPYLGWGVSPHCSPSWPSTWDSSSKPSCARAATALWTWSWSSQGRKESDTTERLNWTELKPLGLTSLQSEWFSRDSSRLWSVSIIPSFQLINRIHWYVWTSLFNHSFMYIHLGCFQLVTIMNKASIHVYTVFVWTLAFMDHSFVMVKGLAWLKEAVSHAKQGHSWRMGHKEEFW